MTAPPVALYDVDIAVQWVIDDALAGRQNTGLTMRPLAEPPAPPFQEALRRSAEVARQLFVQDYPDGQWWKEELNKTDIAYYYLTVANPDLVRGGESAIGLAALPFEDGDPIPRDVLDPFATVRPGAKPPEVLEVQQRQSDTPYPKPSALPLDRYPSLGVGVWPAAPVATPLPPASLYPAPSIATLTPATAPISTPGEIAVQIAGTGFVSGAIAQVGPRAVPTLFVSDTTLVIQVAPSVLTPAGSFPVTVKNPDNQTAVPATFITT
jgi:hypothetical protein